MVDRSIKGHSQDRSLTVSKSRSFQHVFRLVNDKPLAKKMKREGPTPTSPSASPVPPPPTNVATRTRRTHKKSRAGCQTCKTRRVKCDESRPGCEKCRQHGVECDYLVTENGDAFTAGTDDCSLTFTQSARSHISDIDLESTHKYNSNTMLTMMMYSPHINLCPFEDDCSSMMTSCLQSLQHFTIFTCPTVTSTAGRDVLGGPILALASQNQYLMHAILGTAAAHLASLIPASQSPFQHERHRKAEAYHWQNALRGFRKDLYSTRPLGSLDADVLITTCMLVGIHIYSTGVTVTKPRFVEESLHSRTEALQWLQLQSGFRVVIQKLGVRLSESAWFSVIAAATPSEFGFITSNERFSGEIGDFLELCHIDLNSCPSSNCYFVALRDLFALLQIESPNMEDFAQYVSFAGRLTGDFQGLLLHRDPAALLILAYWLALMYQLKLWWIRDRAAVECKAIVQYLQQSADLLILRLLEFPTKVIYST